MGPGVRCAKSQPVAETLLQARFQTMVRGIAHVVAVLDGAEIGIGYVLRDSRGGVGCPESRAIRRRTAYSDTGASNRVEVCLVQVLEDRKVSTLSSDIFHCRHHLAWQ